MKKLDKDDRKFIKAITQATAAKTIQDLDISTMLLVNRALNQSTRQLIFCMKEILLTDVESEILEKLNEDEFQVDCP